MDEIQVGKVLHYFDKAGVAVIQLNNDALAVGDSIRVMGKTTNFTQKVASLQLEHKQVEKVEAGTELALKVDGKCHRNDTVSKIV